MYKRRRFSSSRYYPYPAYRSRVVRRRSTGYVTSLKWFLMDLLTGMVLVIVAFLFVLVLFALLTHLHQVQAFCTQIHLLVTAYGPLVLVLASILAGCFLVLGTVYGIVKVLAAISETLSHASVVHAQALQARANVESSTLWSTQTVPIPKIRFR